MKTYYIDEPVIDVSVHILAYWSEQIFRNGLYSSRNIKFDKKDGSSEIVVVNDSADVSWNVYDNAKTVHDGTLQQINAVIDAAYGPLGDSAYMDKVKRIVNDALDIRISQIDENVYTPESVYYTRSKFIPNQIALNERIGIPRFKHQENEKLFVAHNLVADAGLFSSTSRMSASLGPVIWEFIRLVLLHYYPEIKEDSTQPASDFSVETFLRYVSAAFSVCVCGNNALAFLYAHDKLKEKVPLWVRKVCGITNVSKSPYYPWSLVNCLHEKVKFNQIKRNDTSDFRNYTFGCRLSALTDAKSFFDPTSAGMNDQSGFIMFRMSLPTFSSVTMEHLLNEYIYGKILEKDGEMVWCRVRYFVQMCYLMEMLHILSELRKQHDQYDMDVLMTTSVFVKSTDLLDGDDYEAFSADGTEYLTKSYPGDRYALSDASVQCLYTGIGTEYAKDSIDFGKTLVETLKNELNIDPEWSVTFFLWWSVMSNRFNPVSHASHLGHMFDTFGEPELVYKLSTRFSPHLTMCHPDVHKDLLCAMLNSKSFVHSIVVKCDGHLGIHFWISRFGIRLLRTSVYFT
uniref:Uncharacterized protein n=1 Tax=Ixodes ricinus TaxID=34613 RepID=A0A0K8RAU6_IXORI